jgi:hypothetical protein
VLKDPAVRTRVCVIKLPILTLTVTESATGTPIAVVAGVAARGVANELLLSTRIVNEDRHIFSEQCAELDPATSCKRAVEPAVEGGTVDGGTTISGPSTGPERITLLTLE